MGRIKIPTEQAVLLNNLTKMIEKKIGIDNYLVTEQDIATKYKVDVEEVILKEKEAINFELDLNPKLRRIKILNNLYTKGLDYYTENDGTKPSDFTDALIINNEGKLLFLLRKEDAKIGPNQWCLPGGHLEKFLSIEKNVLKEIKEETNLDIIETKLVAVKPIANDKKIYYFLCVASSGYGNQVVGEVTINNDEHSNYQWMSLQEIKDTPSDKFIFDLKDYILNTLLKVKQE